MGMNRWFCIAADGDVTFHETADDARNAACRAIELALDEEWDEGVDDICWGEVRGRAVQSNVRECELGCAGLHDFHCDYVLENVSDE